MQTLGFLESLPVFKEYACMCPCVHVCVCMRTRSMNIWMCALITYTEARTAHVSSSAVLHLSPLQQGLSLNLKLTFSEFLADHGALRLHLALPPVLGLQARAAMLAF